MICLRISRLKGYQVPSGEYFDKHLGTLYIVQWIRAAEWSVDPLGVIALLNAEFMTNDLFFGLPLSHFSSQPHLRSESFDA